MSYTNSQDWDALAPYWVNLVETTNTDENDLYMIMALV